ncbi:MAG: hypothetical protein QM731_05070 [Chitinophagaceae bacterium]
MKNIIIPYLQGNTTLEMFRLALQLYPQSVAVNFLEICPLPDNYNDLTTLSRDKQHCFKDTEFVKAVQHLRSRYATQVQEVNFDYIYGYAPAVFRNYAHGRGADLVMYYDNGTRTELTRMLLRSRLPLLYVNKLPIGIEAVRNINGKQSELAPAIAEHAYEWEEAGKTVLQGNGQRTVRSQHIPDSIVQQFALLDSTLTNVSHQLKDSLYNTHKLNYLQRYFLNGQKLNALLQQDNRQMLLLM